MPRSRKERLAELNREIKALKVQRREIRAQLQDKAAERSRLREQLLNEFGVAYVEQGVEETHGRSTDGR